MGNQTQNRVNVSGINLVLRLSAKLLSAFIRISFSLLGEALFLFSARLPLNL